MRRAMVLAIVAGAWVGYCPALADLCPTHQLWRFDEPITNPEKILPDEWSNLFGDPYIEIIGEEWELLAEYYGRTNVLHVWGTTKLMVYVPNYPNAPPPPEYWKEIWYELVYHDCSPSYTWDPAFPWHVCWLGWKPDGWWATGCSAPDPLGPFPPCPPEERLWISPGATGHMHLDSIEIWTNCVPEPAGVLLLGLGAMVGLRRR